LDEEVSGEEFGADMLLVESEAFEPARIRNHECLGFRQLLQFLKGHGEYPFMNRWNVQIHGLIFTGLKKNR
jgi:hypothetical protein